MKTVFKRKLYDRLLQWKNERQGTTALLVEGARRVGKSTLVEEFAKREYKSYILIDFNNALKSTIALFEELPNLNTLFAALQNTYNVRLFERKSVIVFDEVQKCPMARQAIKYLVADGRYDYIETGSLISIRKNVQNITIPSEEERVTMHPMDYEEFRWALSDSVSVPLMRQAYSQKMPLGAAHRQKMRELRLYMLVGGMPQAVNTYLETNNFMQVDRTKRDIIRLYEEDFKKIIPTGQLGQLFMSIPAQLNRSAGRFVPFNAIGGVSSGKLSEMIQALDESKTVVFSYHCTDPNVGMSLYKDFARYKIYLADTGLFVTLCFWDKDYTENIIYEKLLSDKLDSNLGYVYENIVAQMLTASGNNLFYYTFPKDDSHNYEIDFLLSRGNKIVPLEVKSSGYKTHKSLDAFCEKFSSRVGDRILVYTKDYAKDGMTTCLPAYFTQFI